MESYWESRWETVELFNKHTTIDIYVADRLLKKNVVRLSVSPKLKVYCGDYDCVEEDIDIDQAISDFEGAIQVLKEIKESYKGENK